MRYDPYNKCNKNVLLDNFQPENFIKQEAPLPLIKNSNQENNNVQLIKKIIQSPQNLNKIQIQQIEKKILNKKIEESDKDLINKIMFNKRESNNDGTRNTQSKK